MMRQTQKTRAQHNITLANPHSPNILLQYLNLRHSNGCMSNRMPTKRDKCPRWPSIDYGIIGEDYQDLWQNIPFADTLCPTLQRYLSRTHLRSTLKEFLLIYNRRPFRGNTWHTAFAFITFLVTGRAGCSLE